MINHYKSQSLLTTGWWPTDRSVVLPMVAEEVIQGSLPSRSGGKRPEITEATEATEATGHSAEPFRCGVGSVAAANGDNCRGS